MANSWEKRAKGEEKSLRKKRGGLTPIPTAQVERDDNYCFFCSGVGGAEKGQDEITKKVLFQITWLGGGGTPGRQGSNKTRTTQADWGAWRRGREETVNLSWCQFGDMRGPALRRSKPGGGAQVRKGGKKGARRLSCREGEGKGYPSNDRVR